MIYLGYSFRFPAYLLIFGIFGWGDQRTRADLEHACNRIQRLERGLRVSLENAADCCLPNPGFLRQLNLSVQRGIRVQQVSYVVSQRTVDVGRHDYCAALF